MRLEVPVLKRFCFCLPLRYGLIVWGYLRLVLSALALVAGEQCFSSMLSQAQTEDDIKYTIYTVLLGVLLVFILADILMNIVFVIGGHRFYSLDHHSAVIQAYILVLVRSVMIKIKKGFEIRFINNAAECECTMFADEDIPDIDETSEDEK
ncbi:hypothetical protein SFRURICE_015558 [Spodoptera frugiperda]|nr:hypothetical protein SFRURICE_015558 [Spodoptera frugiperda]